MPQISEFEQVRTISKEFSWVPDPGSCLQRVTLEHLGKRNYFSLQRYDPETGLLYASYEVDCGSVLFADTQPILKEHFEHYEHQRVFYSHPILGTTHGVIRTTIRRWEVGERAKPCRDTLAVQYASYETDWSPELGRPREAIIVPDERYYQPMPMSGRPCRRDTREGWEEFVRRLTFRDTILVYLGAKESRYLTLVGRKKIDKPYHTGLILPDDLEIPEKLGKGVSVMFGG